MTNLFSHLEKINQRPEPFSCDTAADLWTDEHISKRMLAYHLDPDIDVSSRRAAFIDRAVTWIGSHFDVCLGTRIADFGCGPGLYANRLAKLGARVTGIDFSQRSIEYARAAAVRDRLSADYVNENYLEFETDDRFDLILMIYCDFCALSPAQRATLLETFHAMLAPGGAVLLDVYSWATFEQCEEAATYGENLGDGFWSARPYYGFHNTFKYDEEKVVLDKYTIVEAERTRTIYNWLQCFSPVSLQREFEDAGFRNLELRGDVAGAAFDETASEFAIVGGKRSS